MQLDALARGWEIQRIFIYDTWTQDLDQLAVEHKTAGVRVKRVLTGEIRRCSDLFAASTTSPRCSNRDGAAA
jgi:hypothetical protein